jgi:hypothetical protein
MLSLAVPHRRSERNLELLDSGAPGSRLLRKARAGRGSLTLVDDACVKTNYPKGTAFVDLEHGHVHTAFNPGSKETVLVATFFEAPPEPDPLLIPATAPAGCTL